MITSTEQFLLLKIMEESSELAHAAAKAAQFGMYDVGSSKQTNVYNLHTEYVDLVATVEALCKHLGFTNFTASHHAKKAKVDKITKYAGIMADLGKVSEEVVKDLQEL